MNYDPFWRYSEFLAERDRDRLAAQLPRLAAPLEVRIRVRLRARLAQALVALATWLSPDVLQPTPAFKLARATRRNGTA
jgi:hypothetical protein